MAIHVITNTTSRRHPEATGWVIDANGYLHVTVKDNGNCASYHPSAWWSVEREEDAK
ncbi:hypothetical protein [Arthrobacter bambusae]|uniref:hypothetical protein n=1 Tax=Arthrobacter bambusae TaxID=1338426 RepID=UPI00277DA8E1|nr:hypothetical protein [Arthrobacter bambusae]MDQ0241179.1 hypothetical protein [Arthrobacter bambusae]